MTEQSTPAGWYPDPQMTRTQRYWDGAGWTEQVAPMQVPTPVVDEPANPILIGLGYLLAVVFPIGGLVVAAVLYRRSQTNAILIAVFSVLAAFIWFDLAT